jgi:hypothetical protein
MMRIFAAKAMAFMLILTVDLIAARGATLSFEANLDGFQEVPPNASPAFGLLDATVNTVSGALTVTTGTYQDLLGGSNAVTINDAAVGSNGATLFSLTLDSPGTTSGTFSGGGTLTAPQIADVEAGKLYVNIRSQVFPSGEIRGQLLSVPEPSTLILAAIGGLALLARCAQFKFAIASSR